jgi:uncharacterized protein (DUF305 family)
MTKQNILTYLILGFLAGLITSTFITSSPAFPHSSMGGMRGNSWNGIYNRMIDRHFIEQMIPHHNEAIAMAELALQISEKAEIRSLANDIIEAQTRENIAMRTWYQEWFGVRVQDSVSVLWMMRQGGVHMMSTTGDLSRLKKAKDFDLEFIRQMIPHHQMAIMMAQMLLSGSERREMLGLAEQIITSQSNEIAMMQDWYQSWIIK